MSLKHRLAVVALLCGAVCLLPTAQLGFNLLEALRTVKAQRAALPANQAWQRVIADLADHRMASAIPSRLPPATPLPRRSTRTSRPCSPSSTTCGTATR